jgi:hypothetical protein
MFRTGYSVGGRSGTVITKWAFSVTIIAGQGMILTTGMMVMMAMLSSFYAPRDG